MNIGMMNSLNMIAGEAAATAAKAEEKQSYMIDRYEKINFFGHTVHLTSTHVSLLIVSVILVVLALIVNKKIKNTDPTETPTGILNIMEIPVEMLSNMVNGIMGKNARRFVNYIITLFFFLVLSNLSGLLGLRPPTADYGITLPLALITFGLIHYNGVKANNSKHFTNLFQPFAILFPINLIGELATPLSLSLRLFGNIMSGTVLMGLIYGLLAPFTVVWPSILHVYFDIFSGCIQAYVFCMLTMVYVNDKIEA